MEAQLQFIAGKESKEFLVSLIATVDRLERVASALNEGYVTTDRLEAGTKAPAKKGRGKAKKEEVAEEMPEEEELQMDEVSDETPEDMVEEEEAAEEEKENFGAEEEEEAKPAKKAKAITPEEVQKACQAYLTKNKKLGDKARAKVLAILEKTGGAKSIGKIPPTKFAAVIAALK